MCACLANGYYSILPARRFSQKVDYDANMRLPAQLAVECADNAELQMSTKGVVTYLSTAWSIRYLIVGDEKPDQSSNSK